MNSDPVKRILDVFKDGRNFLSLRDLAKAAGFPRASDHEFRQDFFELTNKGILKLQQSGWRSEKRGHAKDHPKTVILTANIYELVDSEAVMAFDRIDFKDDSVLVGLQHTISVKQLPISEKKLLSQCPDCKRTPVVFVTSEKIPVCSKHWNRLTRTDVEWES